MGWEGRGVRTHAHLYSTPPVPPVPPSLPIHLLPYVPGWASLDVFTAASGVHTGSRHPDPEIP